MDATEVISLYESVADLTDQMLAAARREEWEQLSKLEMDCAYIVAMLKKNEDGITLTGDRRERKIEVLKKILDDNRDIINLVEPGLKKLSALIQSTRINRKLVKAYGVNRQGA